MRVPSSLPETVRPSPAETGEQPIATQLADPNSAMPPAEVPELRPRTVAARLRMQLISRAEHIVNRVQCGEHPGRLRKQPPAGDASWTQKNGEVAAEALQMVRLALYDKKTGSHKSSNKFNTKQFEEESERIRHAYRGSAKPIAEKSPPDIVNRAALKACHAALISKSLWEATSINCSGLAFAAQDYVGQHYPYLQTSSVALGGQHVLAVIGTLEPECATLPLSAWDRHITVCDPWANIVCAAPDYPEKFWEKMNKWQSEGKMILNAKEKWVLPTDADWCACVNEVPRVLTRLQYQNDFFVNVPMVLPPGNASASEAERTRSADCLPIEHAGIHENRAE